MMNSEDIGNKIIVLGCSGSGKSTFSVRLHEKIGLPLYHLDNIWWKPDKTHITREEFDRKLQDIMCGEKWILDGDYSRTYDVRFACCDTVIFLDYPTDVCMDGIIRRLGKPRRDIPFVDDRLDPDLVELVQKYYAENRPVVHALMRKYPKNRNLIFETRHQAEKWLTER